MDTKAEQKELTPQPHAEEADDELDMAELGDDMVGEDSAD